MKRTCIKIGISVFAALAVIFVFAAVTLLQPASPPRPHPVRPGLTSQLALLLLLPAVALVVLVVVQLQRARRRGTIDGRGRLVVGPSPDGVEAAIRQRAASDGFGWLICAMLLDSAASVVLDRQPLPLVWWPLVGMLVFALAFTLRRRQLS